MIAAELCGFFDAYLRETSFIPLLRRDIVAQAVSCVKAKRTGQYHSTQKPMKAAFTTSEDRAIRFDHRARRRQDRWFVFSDEPIWVESGKNLLLTLA